MALSQIEIIYREAELMGILSPQPRPATRLDRQTAVPSTNRCREDPITRTHLVISLASWAGHRRREQPGNPVPPHGLCMAQYTQGLGYQMAIALFGSRRTFQPASAGQQGASFLVV